MWLNTSINLSQDLTPEIGIVEWHKFKIDNEANKETIQMCKINVSTYH